MNRLPLVILAILVLGSAGFGVYQLDQVQKLTRNAATWESERAALQKTIWDLKKKNGDLEKRRAAGPAPALAAQGGESTSDEARRDDAAGGPGARFRSRTEGGGSRFGAVMGSPEVQRLMALQQKAALDGHYSSLFKQLQLSPADLEKFKSLLVDKQAAVMDVMAAARGEGLSGREDRDQIRQLVQDAQAEVDNSIRATLGDAAYAQYQNYEATQPQRNVVTQLEQRLSYSATPLTDAQSQQLVQILASSTPTTGSGANSGTAAVLSIMGGGPRGFGGSSTPITDAAVNQAQGILSAQQLSALQSLQQEQQASALLMKQMRENFQPKTPTTGTGSGTQTAVPTPAR